MTIPWVSYYFWSRRAYEFAQHWAGDVRVVEARIGSGGYIDLVIRHPSAGRFLLVMSRTHESWGAAAYLTHRNHATVRIEVTQRTLCPGLGDHPSSHMQIHLMS